MDWVEDEKEQLREEEKKRVEIRGLLAVTRMQLLRTHLQSLVVVGSVGHGNQRVPHARTTQETRA
jgi:hypothetical protein